MTGKCRNCKYRDETLNVCKNTQRRCTGKCTISVGIGIARRTLYEPKSTKATWVIAL